MKYLNLYVNRILFLFATAFVCLIVFTSHLSSGLTDIKVFAQVMPTYPRLCLQSTTMPSPPPVLFKVSGKAIVSGTATDECSDFRDQEPTASPRGQFSVSSSTGGRSAIMSGSANVNNLSGSFMSLVNEEITGYDQNSSTEGLIEIYIRGFRTKYVLNATFNGSVQTQSSSTSGRYGACVYDNITGTATCINELDGSSATQNHNTSFTSAPDAESGGICFSLPQYPDIPYCRIYSTHPAYPIRSSAGGRISLPLPPPLPNYNLNARAEMSNFSFNVHLNEGVQPNAIIKGPILNGQEVSIVPVGSGVLFNSLSYDPDNNQGTTPGAGILSWKWTVKDPNGVENEYPSETVAFSTNLRGQYKVTLSVTDDEGMTATTSKLFLARPPTLMIDPVTFDYGAVVKGVSSIKTLTVRNSGPSGGMLNVTLGNLTPFRIVDGVSNFSLNGGESRAVNIEYKPESIRMDQAILILNSNDPDRPTASVLLQGATKATFTFWIKAFIPGVIPDYTIVMPVPPEDVAGRTYVPAPFPIADYFVYGQTDQRSFNTDITASARITLGGRYRIIGYNQFEGGTNLPAYSDPTKICDLPPVLSPPLCIPPHSAEPSGKFYSPEVLKERHFRIGFYARGKPGYAPPGSPEINIDDGAIDVDFVSGTLNASGFTDLFPSYEMYMIIDDSVNISAPIELFTHTAVPPVTNIKGRRSNVFSNPGIKF